MRRQCPKLEGGMRRNVAGARSEGLRLRLKVRGGKLGGGALHSKAAETPGISEKQGCFPTSHACSCAVGKATATIVQNRTKGTGTQREIEESPGDVKPNDPVSYDKQNVP